MFAVVEYLNDALRDWRKMTARKQGVESDVVLPRLLMEKIAFKQPVNRKSFDLIMSESPWRLKHSGEEIWSIVEEVLHS